MRLKGSRAPLCIFVQRSTLPKSVAMPGFRGGQAIAMSR